MSRKLGAFTLALGILVGSMAFKSALTNHKNHTSGTTLVANGPDPVPPMPRRKS